MKLGLLTACLPAWDLEAIAGLAARHGYEAIEIACWPAVGGRPFEAAHLDADRFGAPAAALPFCEQALELQQGTDNRFQPVGDPVPVLLTAAGGGTHVLVLDGSGDKVFEGDLAFGESKTLHDVATPVQVQASDGSLQVSLDGKDRGTVGNEGEPAKNTFVSR